MLVLNPQSQDAIKNYLIADETVCLIYDIHVRHRDSYTKAYMSYISQFDVAGYTMHYKFEPKNYVFIHVDYGKLKKSVFIAEVSLFDKYLLKNFFLSYVRIKYNGF